jgi:hypothetical protein
MDQDGFLSSMTVLFMSVPMVMPARGIIIVDKAEVLARLSTGDRAVFIIISVMVCSVS